MALHVALTHRTTYRYDRPVQLGPQVVRLRPAPHCRTPILSYSLTVEPRQHFLNWQQDPFGNYLARLVFPEQDRELRRRGRSGRRHGGRSIRSTSSSRTSAETYPFDYEPTLRKELRRTSRPMPAGPLLERLVERSTPPRRRRPIDFLVELNQRLQQRDQLRRSAWSRACRRREETLSTRSRLVPRLRLAAGADPAAPRLRRALRVRLPDPARRRT